MTNSASATGRVAGGVYLMFGAMYVVGASLATHATPSSPSFRTAVGVELLADLAFMATALCLFALLRTVQELAAIAMLSVVAVASAVGFVLHVLQLTGQGGLSAATTAAASALFSGLWLMPLSYLVLKSQFFPKVVGILLGAAGVSWLAQFAVYFFAPSLSVRATIFQVGAVGELVFIAWLLIFSSRPAPAKRGADRKVDPHRRAGLVSGAKVESH